MGKKPLRLVTILPSLMTISNVVMLKKWFLVCHVISQGHIGTVVVNIYNAFSLQQKVQNHGQKMIKASHHSASYIGHSHCDSRDIFLVCHVILEDHVTKRWTNLMGRSH